MSNSAWQAAPEGYQLIEALSLRAAEEEATRGRPTSMLSKLAHAISLMLFIPYDSRVRAALRLSGKVVKDHDYRGYMRAVFSEKPAFDRELAGRGLSPTTLKATSMSQVLFEMRALDKWLMLRGGFNPDRMRRDLVC